MLLGIRSMMRSVAVFLARTGAADPGSTSEAPSPGRIRFDSVRPISIATRVLIK